MANKRFTNALARIPQGTPPVWMMRQAGRYHKHYQNLRADHSFMELCKKPELAAEVALGPIQDFDFDVSIMFSDLLFPLEALGMGLDYTEQGPKLGWHLETGNISKLRKVDEAIQDLEFQKTVLQTTRAKLPADKSLIGFVGGPWTLFVYAVEGGHSGNLLKSKPQPELYSHFAEIIVPLLIQNIQLQLDGGAEAVMIFDTAAGELSPGMYQDLVVPHLLKIADKFPKKIGYYSKGTTASHYWGPLSGGAWAGFGYDHRFDLSDVLQETRFGFVQGNFDQALLFTPPARFESVLRNYLAQFANLTPEQRAGWICGLGHGVLPKTPEINVKNFVRIVRETF
jgi:uroporphyrinogen decarboxylase